MEHNFDSFLIVEPHFHFICVDAFWEEYCTKHEEGICSIFKKRLDSGHLGQEMDTIGGERATSLLDKRPVVFLHPV